MPSNQQVAVNKAPTIVLTGGGSGGHITPLLSLAHELKRRSLDNLIIYIGLKGDKIDRLSDEYAVFDEVYYVSSGKFRRYHGESLVSHLLDVKTLLLNAGDFFKVVTGIFQSRRILKRAKPDVVFSKGGFVAVPVGVAAKTLSIPIVTHDSDTVPGLANRIIGRWATIHATGMPADYYKYKKQTMRYVGIPVGGYVVPVSREMKAQYQQEVGIDQSKKIVLISGGGLGAQTLNELVVQMSPELLNNHSDIAIVHFTGQGHEDEVNRKYQEVLPEKQRGHVRVIGFSLDFHKYSGAADLVITRAGATTLAELAIQGKACIIIPSPFLTGGHQVKNAHRLSDMGAAITIPNNATPHELYKKTDALLIDDGLRNKLAEKFATTAKINAASELASAILEVAASKQK